MESTASYVLDDCSYTANVAFVFIFTLPLAFFLSSFISMEMIIFIMFACVYITIVAIDTPDYSLLCTCIVMYIITAIMAVYCH